MRHFTSSFIFTIIALGLAFLWGYKNGDLSVAFGVLLIASALALMEISLSFDNAVVNASILKHWDRRWKMLFMTVGMLIAVFGMRLIFPIVIVAHTADLGYLEVWRLALNSPDEYSAKLTAHHAEISAFGGIFLLLVFLNFLLDESKEIHWIKSIESRLKHLGKVDAISIFIAIVVLMIFSSLSQDRLSVLLAGLWGIIIYVSVSMIGFFLDDEGGDSIKKGSIGGFLYLEVLDASFSFDGVIGSFAITKDIVIIMLGLAIGAMFVRSMTIYLVEKGTLSEYIYLEHGAHYAIGVLAIIMLLGTKLHINELFTASIGIILILLSLYSSQKERKLANK